MPTPEEEVPPVSLGDVLEDANGYCLLVTAVDDTGQTFTARDFPEQVHTPCLSVTRAFLNNQDIVECFVIRRPRPEELIRLQRFFGEVPDGVWGPRTARALGVIRPPAPEVPEEVKVPSVDATPSRFDRDVDVGPTNDAKPDDPVF
jgi:hypothetical protein